MAVGVGAHPLPRVCRQSHRAAAAPAGRTVRDRTQGGLGSAAADLRLARWMMAWYYLADGFPHQIGLCYGRAVWQESEVVSHV